MWVVALRLLLFGRAYGLVMFAGLFEVWRSGAGGSSGVDWLMGRGGLKAARGNLGTAFLGGIWDGDYSSCSVYVLEK